MTEVSIDQLAAARADGALVVDVREPAEYVQGHVPGALLMPLSDVTAAPNPTRRSGPGRPTQTTDHVTPRAVTTWKDH